jgi:hypothetical protein
VSPEVEALLRLRRAREVALEQRDPDSEVCVLFEPASASEALLLQEIERLHEALGVS